MKMKADNELIDSEFGFLLGFIENTFSELEKTSEPKAIRLHSKSMNENKNTIL